MKSSLSNEMRGFLRYLKTTKVNKARTIIPPSAPPTIAGIFLLVFPLELLEGDGEVSVVDCGGSAEERDVTTVT